MLFPTWATNHMCDLFIDGGAYGLIYYVGVTSQLPRPRRRTRVYGISAGAVVGAMYLLGFSTAEQLALYHSISDNSNASIRASPFDPSSYNITPHHLTALKALIDAHPDAYTKCSPDACTSE